MLARRIEYQIEEQFNLNEALCLLESRYRNCIVFAHKQNNSIFFGATPERLFTLNQGVLTTDALAGSIGRGTNEEEDLVLESTLLNSRKNLSEHNDVLDYLVSKLEPLTSCLKFDKTPGIKKLNNIQHLWTPITGKLNSSVPVSELINTLHPTPAVCGLPSSAALDLILEYEEFDRGLFAGVIGWLSEKNEGEFVVGLRSALLKENRLFAYAGSGIVEGSDPLSEYNETELKLKPILSLFSYEDICQSK